jgi:hypothetical protein
MRRLLGFAICLVVGALLSFVVLALRIMWALPREVTGDSMQDARWVVIGAVAFAIVCDAVRARIARSSPIPRALATRDR